MRRSPMKWAVLVKCISSFANLSRHTPSCLLWVEVHVFVCCECVCASSFSLHPFPFKATECCYDNPSWSLLHRSGPQCRHSGSLLALGRQHKIGIIAVDYGTQWATASERFIHPGKRDCAGGKKKKGCLGPSAALPRWAQAWHQWPERTGILDIPTPPQSYPSAPAYSTPSPPSFSFLGSASLDAALGQATWGHCHCLHVKQSPSEGKERKRRASHGTSQEQGWLPLPTPSKAPLLPEKYWCDPHSPFSPSVPLTPPL